MVARVPSERIFHLRMFMSRVVVHDDTDVQIGRRIPMSGKAAFDFLSGERFGCGKERRSSIAPIVVGLPQRMPRLSGRILARFAPELFDAAPFINA